MASGHIGRRAPRKDGSPGSWFYTVELPPGPDGKRRQRQKSGFRTKKLAQEALNRLLAEVQSGTYQEVADQTFGEFLAFWLEQHAPTVRISTAETYEREIRVHLTPGLGRIKLTRLTPILIQQFLTEKRKTVGPSTMELIWAILNTSLSRARRWRLISENPCLDVDKPRAPLAEEPPRDALSEEDLIRVVAAAEGWLRLALLLGIATGCRRGEALGAKWEDMDLERGVWIVSRSLGYTRANGVALGPTKTGSKAPVTLPPLLLAELKRWRAAQSELRLLCGPDYADWGLVLARPDGQPYHPSVLTTAVRSHFDRVGVKGSYHNLRHTHATFLLGEQIDPNTVAKRLGHRRAGTTTDTYGHRVLHLEERSARVTDGLLQRVVGDRSGVVDPSGGDAPLAPR